jgi:hypothetical protein
VACVFCGDLETTNEHVFPQWLLKVIPGDGGRITHNWEAPAGSSSESRTWTTDLLTFKAKVVCGPTCNHGWMNDLENAARPFLESMIQGRGRTLYDRGRELVAFWGVKTAMMTNLAQEVEHQCIPMADYRALYSAQGVLPHTFVWLGGSDFGTGALARHRTLYRTIGDRRVHGYGATVNVGHLVIEIIRVEVEDGEGLQIGGQLAPILRRIWPETQSVAWPPPIILNRPQVQALGEMLEVVPVSLVRP